MKARRHTLLTIALGGALLAGCATPAQRAKTTSQPQVAPASWVDVEAIAGAFHLQLEIDHLTTVHRLVGTVHRVALAPGLTYLMVDGEMVPLSRPPRLSEGRLYVGEEAMGMLRTRLGRPAPPVMAPPAAPAAPVAQTPVAPAPPRKVAVQSAMPAGWKVRANRTWRYLVIHHSATDEGGADRFHRSHARKWQNGLGYHFVVGNGTDTPDGAIEVGTRWLRQNQGIDGAHAGNLTYNRYGIGICLVGNFDQGQPTARQMASLRFLIRTLAHHYRISPGNIVAHSDVRRGGTHCPGKHFPMADLVRHLR